MVGRRVDANPGSLAYLAPELTTADLALANLESPLALFPPISDSRFNLCTSSDRADLLSNWGLDLLSLANNHSFDCGPDGPLESSTILEHVWVASISPSMQPVYRRVNDLQMAFLAFDDITSPLDEDAAIQAIRLAHASDLVVIVSVHWGLEYQAGASERQKYLAHQFAQAGAALVWGHHPHVLQPVVWIDSTMGRTLVFYSLGNALFDQAALDSTRQSALVVIKLGEKGVVGYRTIPFEINVAKSLIIQPDDKTAARIRGILSVP
jgi:poly-gamma-glutamate capsule biosynthesis protein CapA/YwtB (metallophosphatase superfamily)